MALILALAASSAGPVAGQANRVVSTQKPQFEGPRMQIVERDQEFGDVPRGELVEAVFQLENVGSETLRILQVKPG